MRSLFQLERVMALLTFDVLKPLESDWKMLICGSHPPLNQGEV